MKTPEEIKKGLTCVCDSPECEDCAYATKVEDKKFGEILQFHCSEIYKDAYDLIIHLESRLAKVEQERDALLDDLRHSFDPCTVCKKQDICEQHCPDNDYNCPDCKDKHRCICHNCTADNDLWEWRGVCEENTKGDVE